MLDLMIAALLQTADPCHDVAQAVPPPANCPAWRRFLQREEADIFVDPATMRRDGAVVDARTLAVFRAAFPSGMRSAISRDRYDCATGTTTWLHLTAYDAAGVVIADFDVTGEQARPQVHPPGSPGAAMMAEFCPR